MDQIFPEKVFQVKTRKSEHHHWIVHIQISLQSVTKTIETHYILMKKSKKMLDFIKDTQNSPFSWFNALASLEKLC